MGFMGKLKELDQIPSVFIAVVCLILISLNQFNYPIVNHDDWDFLFEQGAVPGFGTPWERTLWEGRWINYLYYGISQNLTGFESSVIFFVFYASFIGLSAYILAGQRFSSILAVALFFSPVSADFSRWPTTLSPAMIILAIVAGFFAVSRSVKYDILVMLAAVYLLVMTYASLSSIVLILYVVKNSEDIPSLTRVVLLFVLAYLSSVISIYGINYFNHGYFGLDIQAWREPHPLRGFGDIHPNAMKYISTLTEAISSWYVFFILSVIGWLLSFFVGGARDFIKKSLFAVFSWILIELLLEIKTGIRIASRSELWIWFSSFIPLAYFIYRSNSQAPRVYGVFALLTSVTITVPFWADIFENETSVMKTLDSFALQAKLLLPFADEQVIYAYGKPRDFPGLYRMQADQIRHLQNAMWGAYRLHVEPCAPELCDKIKNTDKKLPISLVDGLVVYRFGK
jgi:hypothetical protein